MRERDVLRPPASAWSPEGFEPDALTDAGVEGGVDAPNEGDVSPGGL